MGDKSKIEWTEATWNPIAGCSLVSEGCRNCYAMRVAERMAGFGQEKYRGLTHRVNGHPVWTGEIRLDEKALALPLSWRAPRRIFVNSMSDLFHEKVSRRTIAAVFGVMALCGQHTFQILTKRPERFSGLLENLDAERCVAEAFQTIGAHATCQMSHEWPLPNVWLGVSCEDQEAADKRIPPLLEAPAAVRWASCEPLLGPLHLHASWMPAYTGAFRIWGVTSETLGPRLHWVVCGGESGPGARPMHPDWACSLRDQCSANGVPFFFKQWGEWIPVFGQRHGLKIHQHFEFPDGLVVGRVGKKAAGRLLDGREWNQYPETEMAVTA